MSKLTLMLESVYAQKLPDSYRRFIDESRYEKFNQKKPPQLPSWSLEMSYPLCFDPEVVVEVFQNKNIWDSSDEFQKFLPLACFLDKHNPKQLSGLDDFLAIEKSPQCAVYLWDHEGEFREVAKSLEDFLSLLT
jgi:hypothetical protein